jgi:hypothetical protein
MLVSIIKDNNAGQTLDAKSRGMVAFEAIPL